MRRTGCTACEAADAVLHSMEHALTCWMRKVDVLAAYAELCRPFESVRAYVFFYNLILHESGGLQETIQYACTICTIDGSGL